VPACIDENIAEDVMPFYRTGLQRERLPAGVYGFLQPVQILQGDSQIAESVGKIGFQGKRLLAASDGLFRTADLPQSVAQI
jgi:hypothetical protein